jgi:hypothetical protein|tara:strand:- start:435 stop:722 length:288 start_codon:yes stop_codon:yes gene_type:complete
MAARLIKFVGEHPKLVTGNSYTSRQYAEVADIPPRAMATRLHRVFEVNEAKLKPLNQNYDYVGNRVERGKRGEGRSAFDSANEKFSGTWLNRGLI